MLLNIRKINSEIFNIEAWNLVSFQVIGSAVLSDDRHQGNSLHQY